MNDLISRQAAINALKKHEIELPIYTPRETDVFWDDAIDCCISEIEALPSAQPEPCEDAVSRKAVQYLLAHFVNEDKYNDACDGLKHLPSVTPKQAEPCEDAVSRQAAIDHWRDIIDATDESDKYNMGFVDGLEFCISHLSTMPSAQPEHKTGRWTPDNTDYYRTKFICSVCGESEEVPTMGFGYAPMWGYCPNCGAKMEGGEQK